LFRAEPVEIGHFTLFSSRLGKEASVYTAEVEYPLR
jgi:2'-5' RNA ligase